MKILKKYNVDEKVVDAMKSHHDDYPYAIPEAYIVTAADVLSAARPGARAAPWKITSSASKTSRRSRTNSRA
jgi:HD superfamily phosphodiesterase